MADGDLTIHQAIVEVINEVGGVGKTGVNKEQHYNFRGIDAVLVHLHPLFAKYGIFFVPEILERQYEERKSSKGTIGHCAHLHVRYTVYGPTGDSITLSTWGEGLDYSDKATNKAMTSAFKYALFQLFAICDPVEDIDRGGSEPGSADDVERSDQPFLEADNLELLGEDTGDTSDTPYTGLQYLAAALVDSGFDFATKTNIIAAAIGRVSHNLGELTDEEVHKAIVAIESAIADRDQLKEEK